MTVPTCQEAVSKCSFLKGQNKEGKKKVALLKEKSSPFRGPLMSQSLNRITFVSIPPSAPFQKCQPFVISIHLPCALPGLAGWASKMQGNGEILLAGWRSEIYVASYSPLAGVNSTDCCDY